MGKDSSIFQSNRLQNHIAHLKNGRHHSPEMQADFDKYGEDAIEYRILKFGMDIEEEELEELEKYYIEKLDAYNSGYNKTLGGVGMWGYKQSPQQRERMSVMLAGENNPKSKITNEEFYEIVDLLRKGYTNDEIADLYGLHSRYVSLIRHKKRFKRLWKTVEDYEPVKSNKLLQIRKLDYESYVEIMKMIESGCTNVDIQDRFELSSGSGSRIRNGHIYKDFYEKYHGRKSPN